MTSPTILIIGANRGIGLNLMKAFAEKNWTLFGSVRPQTINEADESVKDLLNTGASILEIDYTDEGSIFRAAERYGTGPLDILINCGGVSVTPEKFEAHTQEILLNRFKIMAVGPYLATKAFLPNLEKSRTPKVINISSDWGSIGERAGTGGYFGYRMAKAALNQFTATLAEELKVSKSKTVVVAVHPGFVPTKLTGFYGEDNMAECMAGVVKLIDGAGPETSGKYLNWKGEEIPF